MSNCKDILSVLVSIRTEGTDPGHSACRTGLQSRIVYFKAISASKTFFLLQFLRQLSRKSVKNLSVGKKLGLCLTCAD